MSIFWKQPPLPFLGNKRKWIKEISNIIKLAIPDNGKDWVIVDLFGGSGLLSRLAKDLKPLATVIYNDFDNYSERLANYQITMNVIKKLYDNFFSYDIERFSPETKDKILSMLLDETENKYFDGLTYSVNILFSGNYLRTREDFIKLKNSNAFIYNRITNKDILPPEIIEKYTADLTVVSEDFRILLDRYCKFDNVFFIVDSPYIQTMQDGYKNDYFRIPDFLDLFFMLEKNNNDFVMFGNQKSNMLDILDRLHKYGKSNRTWQGYYADKGRIAYNVNKNDEFIILNTKKNITLRQNVANDEFMQNELEL